MKTKTPKVKLSINKDLYKVTLQTTTDLLGSQPANFSVFKDYLYAKIEKELRKIEKEIERALKKFGDSLDLDHPLVQKREELVQKLKKLEEEGPQLTDIDEKGLTVFPRDEETGKFLVIYNYQILGCLKQTAHDFFSKKIRGARNLITRYFAVKPREILLKDGETGEPLTPGDVYIKERPLRAYTPAGYVVSIARSEALEPPVRIEFALEVWGAGELHPFTEEKVLELLVIAGEQEGLLQWRNAGFGRFEVLEFLKLE
jgi:hypothetical protein